jgi:hypothetical protein
MAGSLEMSLRSIKEWFDFCPRVPKTRIRRGLGDLIRDAGIYNYHGRAVSCLKLTFKISLPAGSVGPNGVFNSVVLDIGSLHCLFLGHHGRIRGLQRRLRRIQQCPFSGKIQIPEGCHHAFHIRIAASGGEAQNNKQ